jgi:hypothetical protein
MVEHAAQKELETGVGLLRPILLCVYRSDGRGTEYEYEYEHDSKASREKSHSVS